MRNLLFTFGFALSCLVACTNQSDAPRAKAAAFAVRRGAFEAKVEFRGVVRSSKRVELRAERRVRVGQVLVRNFQTVKKGDALIELDVTEAERQRKELADKAKSLALDVESAQVKYGFATKTFARKKGLHAKGIIAKRELEDAERDFRVSDSELRAKKLEVDKTDRELKEMQARLSASRYSAPMDGTVESLFSPNHSSYPDAAAGTLLAMVSDPSDLALWGKVEENHVKQIAVGATATVRLDSFPDREFPAKVLEVRLQPEDPQRAGMKLYEVALGFAADVPDLREGFAGGGTIVYSRKENALLVPTAAIRYVGSDTAVLASPKASRTPAARTVTLGLKTDIEAEILTGLTETDYVFVEAP